MPPVRSMPYLVRWELIFLPSLSVTFPLFPISLVLGSGFKSALCHLDKLFIPL